MDNDEIEEILEDEIRRRNESLKSLRSQLNFTINSMIAGAGAGLLCTFLCAPMDNLKVRMQVQGQLGLNKYKGGLFLNTQQIIREEGVRGLYKGVGPAMMTVPIFWGFYWPIYNGMKSHFAKKYPTFPTHIAHLLSAISAGAVGDIITNPFWVIRTRLQTLTMHSESTVSNQTGTIQMMRIIYKEEGFKAFYKGLGASFLGLSHVAIQFPLYEYLKEFMQEHFEEAGSVAGIITASITSKLVASSISYPHEVLRSRLQDGRSVTSANGTNEGGVFRLVSHIIRTEGVWTLWAGLRVNLIRVVPATMSTFLSYEYLSSYLNSSN